MLLPTPDCPLCMRRTEDHLDRFACPAGCAVKLRDPQAYYLEVAVTYGRSALEEPPRLAGVLARWAARAAMRAVPELRA